MNACSFILVGGGTCALGYAAVQLAKVLGCKVIASTYREEKLSLLTNAGVDESVVDDGILTGRVHGVTKALDLVAHAI